MEGSSADLQDPAQNASYKPAELPPEILHSIINQLGAEESTDKRALLDVSLVSKQTLDLSRRILFSTVVFEWEYDEHFYAFLNLLDSSWTSLSSIRKLHIYYRYHRRPSSKSLRDPNDPSINMERVLSHLKNVKSLWLTYTDWCNTTPRPVVRLVGGLDITDIQFDTLSFGSSNDMRNLLEQLPQTIETVTIYNARYFDTRGKDETSDQSLAPNATSVYEKKWHFQNLDAWSIAQFKRIWEPFLLRNTKITVETLYIHLGNLTRPLRQDNLTFISDLLKLIGPSLKAISFTTGNNDRFDNKLILAFEALDFRLCNNIDRIHIALIEPLAQRDEMTLWFNFIWKILTAIVSFNNSPRHIIFTILDSDAERWDGEEDIDQLVTLWADILTQIHERYPCFEKIILRVGYRYAKKTHQYVEVLRKTELKRLEASGLFGFQQYMWKTAFDPLVTDMPLDWRDEFAMDNLELL